LSTMYRILRAHNPVRERRNQRIHPPCAKPRLVATRPNQVWTWDISKLAGPRPGVYYSLYVILDLYSRYVVGWDSVKPTGVGSTSRPSPVRPSSPVPRDGSRCGAAVKGRLRPSPLDGAPPHRLLDA